MDQLADCPPALRDGAVNVLQSGGKRLRPILHLLFADVLGYRGDQDVLHGTVVEYIHVASLLHDAAREAADEGLLGAAESAFRAALHAAPDGEQAERLRESLQRIVQRRREATETGARATVSVASAEGYVTDPLNDFFMDRYAEAYRVELETFCAVIRGESVDYPNGLDGVEALRLADTAARSLTSGIAETVASEERR